MLMWVFSVVLFVIVLCIMFIVVVLVVFVSRGVDRVSRIVMVCFME